MGFIKPQHNKLQVTPLITWHRVYWGDYQGQEGSLFWLVEA